MYVKKSRSLLIILILTLIFTLNGTVHAGKIPKGKVERFMFENSKIFPGTVRKVFVYIPYGLSGSKTACVYFQQDGLDKQKKFPALLDTLIEKKEIPVLVGIFVTPGKVNPPEKNTLPRPNRDFEYDGLGDRYARFLIEEILPEVEKRYNLRLSKNGNDHAIGGASSGGIAAFNAAWERPDAFTRVYCNSGSFVAFRGGHVFPTLIRKTEPRPIRAFLTAGTYDMENCAGDWSLINLEMEKALKFSGYDYQFHLLEGKHVVGYGELFADAMRYIWKGWPNPVQAGKGAPRVRDIILPDEPWQLVSSDFKNITGSTSNSKGEVFFACASDNKIYKISPEGEIRVFAENGGTCDDLCVGPGNELYAISSETGRILRFDAGGKATVYANHIHGEHIFVTHDGNLYVSTPPLGQDQGKVMLVKQGKTPIVVDTGLKHPTGIAMSPDRWLLAVADGESHWAYSYEVTKDGTLRNKERFFWLHVRDADDDSGATSICYDREGHLYVCTWYGIQICAWDGPTQVILPLPDSEKVTGICFGGENNDVLYTFCGDKIYKRQVKTHGIGPFSSWMKMTRGKL